MIIYTGVDYNITYGVDVCNDRKGSNETVDVIEYAQVVLANRFLHVKKKH